MFIYKSISFMYIILKLHAFPVEMHVGVEHMLEVQESFIGCSKFLCSSMDSSHVLRNGI